VRIKVIVTVMGILSRRGGDGESGLSHVADPVRLKVKTSLASNLF